MKRAYADIPEGQVHYRAEGSGKPLLLLHQTPMSSREYSRMTPILATKFWVIGMDTLGYGESDPTPYEYQIGDYARSVISFLDALNIKQTNILGHHTGSSIAVEIAAIYPERVEKLVLSGLPLFTAEEKLSRLRDPAFRPLQLKPDGSHLLKPWRFIQERISNKAPRDILFESTVDILKAGIRGEEGHWAAHKHDTRSRLPFIKSPTLVVSGTEDYFYDRIEETGRLIPNAKTAIIEGGDGLICRLKPRELAEVALAFLTEPST